MLKVLSINACHKYLINIRLNTAIVVFIRECVLQEFLDLP